MTHGGKRKGAGRPKGSNYLTETRKKLLQHSEQLVDTLVQQALDGDMNALKLCIERLLPIAKNLPVHMEPMTSEKTKEYEATHQTMKEIKKRVLAGELSTDEALQQIEFLQEIDKRIRHAEPSPFDKIRF